MKDIFDLRHGDCRWPIQQQPTLFCAEPAEPDRSYCEHHCRVAYLPAEKRPTDDYRGMADALSGDRWKRIDKKRTGTGADGFDVVSRFTFNATRTLFGNGGTK